MSLFGMEQIQKLEKTLESYPSINSALVSLEKKTKIQKLYLIYGNYLYIFAIFLDTYFLYTYMFFQISLKHDFFQLFRKLMDELQTTMTIYRVWGSHLGSSQLFKQHLESRRRITEFVEKVQVRKVFL